MVITAHRYNQDFIPSPACELHVAWLLYISEKKAENILTPLPVVFTGMRNMTVLLAELAYLRNIRNIKHQH